MLAIAIYTTTWDCDQVAIPNIPDNIPALALALALALTLTLTLTLTR